MTMSSSVAEKVPFQDLCLLFAKVASTSGKDAKAQLLKSFVEHWRQLHAEMHADDETTVRTDHFVVENKRRPLCAKTGRFVSSRNATHPSSRRPATARLRNERGKCERASDSRFAFSFFFLRYFWLSSTSTFSALQKKATTRRNC